jgi:Domain of unknown function (DUF4276)
MRSNLLRTDQPDGLKTTPIGRWALDKYSLVSLYAELFSTGMKAKWPTRVYVDLCAGSGLSEIEGAASLYWGSPLLALGVPHPFDRYILCERDPLSQRALRVRVTLTAAIQPARARAYVVLIPKREIEAWLLCDARAIARAFNENQHPPLPGNPELLTDPKKHLRDLIWRRYRKDYLNAVHNGVIAKHVNAALLSKCPSFAPHYVFVAAVRQLL